MVLPAKAHGAEADKGGSASEAPETTEKLEAIRREIVRINAVVMQGKCHCVHVDALNNRLTAAESKIEDHTRAMTILVKSIEQLRGK